MDAPRAEGGGRRGKGLSPPRANGLAWSDRTRPLLRAPIGRYQESLENSAGRGKGEMEDSTEARPKMAPPGERREGEQKGRAIRLIILPSRLVRRKIQSCRTLPPPREKVGPSKRKTTPRQPPC